MQKIEILSNEIKNVENYEIEKIEIEVSYYDDFLEQNKTEKRILLYIQKDKDFANMRIINYQNNNMFYLSQIFYNDFENSKEYLDIFNEELENNREIKADYQKLYENLNKSDLEVIFDIYSLINIDLEKSLDISNLENFLESQENLAEFYHNFIIENHFNDDDIFNLLQVVYQSIISR